MQSYKSYRFLLLFSHFSHSLNSLLETSWLNLLPRLLLPRTRPAMPPLLMLLTVFIAEAFIAFMGEAAFIAFIGAMATGGGLEACW